MSDSPPFEEPSDALGQIREPDGADGQSAPFPAPQDPVGLEDPADETRVGPEGAGHVDEQAQAAPSASGELIESFESGVASMFAAFERTVLSVIRPSDQPAGDSQEVADELVDPKTAAVAAGPAARTRDPLTYDDVLPPIRWKAMLYVLVSIVILSGIYFGATFLQVWAASDNDDTQAADAIVVLGAAQFDGTPSPVFAARLDQAHQLWQDGLAPVIVTTGSNQEGDRFTEGFSGYVYLLELGVPDEALLPIVDGGDTWQQMSATANQLEVRELDTALLVSDGYHTFRLLAIADEVGIDAWVSPTDVQPTMRDYVREATAVSIGRIIGYRRISAVSTPE